MGVAMPPPQKWENSLSAPSEGQIGGDYPEPTTPGMAESPLHTRELFLFFILKKKKKGGGGGGPPPHGGGGIFVPAGGGTGGVRRKKMCGGKKGSIISIISVGPPL